MKIWRKGKIYQTHLEEKKKTNPLFQQEEAEHYQKNNYKDTVNQTA